jgi:hypothetical protein
VRLASIRVQLGTCRPTGTPGSVGRDAAYGSFGRGRELCDRDS